jgi:hypothetical protein
VRFFGASTRSLSVTSSRISSQCVASVSHTPTRSREARRGRKDGWPTDSNTWRSSGSARNTSRGTDVPEGDAIATSRQNDRLRMSNECAVDLVLVSEWSTRSVTSGRARHSARTFSTMSSGTSAGVFTRSSDAGSTRQWCQAWTSQSVGTGGTLASAVHPRPNVRCLSDPANYAWFHLRGWAVPADNFSGRSGLLNISGAAATLSALLEHPEQIKIPPSCTIQSPSSAVVTLSLRRPQSEHLPFVGSCCVTGSMVPGPPP